MSSRFVNADGHSRARLKITHKMLLLSFVYSQAMPEFVEYLSFFGKQIKAENLLFSGFHQRTRALVSDQGIRIPQRCWSGYDQSICYSLKSIEGTVSHEPWPWSIRHCAVYHSFDLRIARSTWIIIKGDDLLERRIRVATSGSCAERHSSLENLDRNFVQSLSVNLVVAEWSTEHWGDYIESLEDKLEEFTEDVIPLDADAPVMIPTRKTLFTWNIRDKTWGDSIHRKEGISHSHTKSGLPNQEADIRTKDSYHSEAISCPNMNEKGIYPLIDLAASSGR